jgi:uncharacterized MAPEG superfamily protein
MGVELKMLLWSIVLGLVQIALAATLATGQRSLAWNAGARDELKPPLTGMAGRLDRASNNFLETFPFFAVAVLMLSFLHKETAQTAIGAQLYFWSRLLYVPAYALGIPYLRTLIWAGSVTGLLFVLRALFGG